MNAIQKCQFFTAFQSSNWILSDFFVRWSNCNRKTTFFAQKVEQKVQTFIRNPKKKNCGNVKAYELHSFLESLLLKQAELADTAGLQMWNWGIHKWRQ